MFSEMIARILVSLYAVPAFGFLGVCFGDPLAWVAADLFLIPAFLYVYKKIKKRLDDDYRCPSVDIPSMYVKNAAGERLLDGGSDGEVVPKDPTTDLSGFDLTEVFCLGCSWHGRPREMPLILMGGKFKMSSLRFSDHSWVTPYHAIGGNGFCHYTACPDHAVPPDRDAG